MEKKEQATEQITPEKKRGYGVAVRIIALVLVVVMLISATSIDFSILKYTGSNSMEAANYLLENTSFLTENRYQRLVSLLTNFNSFDIAMQAADSAIGKSDYARAAKYLNRCLSMDQAKEQLPELNMRLGCVYMLDEKLPEAGACFDRTIELSPDNAEAYLLRAQVRVNTEDVKGAVEDSNRYMELGGSDKDMLLAAASIAEYAEDYSTAIKATRILLAAALNDTQRAGYNAEIGRYMYLQGHEAAAGMYIKIAKDLDVDALDGIHYAILALDEMNKGAFPAASADFRAAGAKADADRESYYGQAMICAYLIPDMALLMDISAEAQRAERMTAQSWMLTGVTLFSQDDYAGGDKAITECLALDPQMAEAHYYRGLCRMQLEDYAGAAEDFTVSIDRDELTLDCYYNRGLCLFILEQYEQAVTDLAYVIDDGSDQTLAKAAYELLQPLIVQ